MSVAESASAAPIGSLLIRDPGQPQLPQIPVFHSSAEERLHRKQQLAAAYWISKDKSHLVRAARAACERLAGGWQFRGGAAGGANDHFSLPGLAVLSQMYLGGALSWLRPASVLPPIACSWEGLDDHNRAYAACMGAKGYSVR